jgi:hypothetical protein
MSEPRQPEDPIWSRWRERHGQTNGGNGAPPHEAAPEPAPEPERIHLGDPLPPDWAESPRASEPPPPQPPPPPPPREEQREEPRGFEARREHARGQHECLEWCPVCRTAEIVRQTFPPEVRAQLEDVQRDALVALRSIIDHYLDRLDGSERPASRVEDIPIL